MYLQLYHRTMCLCSARILVIPLLILCMFQSSCDTGCKEEVQLPVVQTIAPDSVDRFQPFTFDYEVQYNSGHYSWKELYVHRKDDTYTLKAIGNFEGCKWAHCAVVTEWKSVRLIPYQSGILRIEADNPRSESIVDSVFVRE